jgi:acyl-CoA synthetase (AMP-forming)/AMP-acid ligase II
VEPGTPGELWVRGYNVMRGYWNDPERTAETITEDGWLRTGDIATIDNRGYVRITDRKKDMIIVGGFNVYPAEVERLMAAHPAIREVAVVGAPDARLGEVPVAFVLADLEPDGETAVNTLGARAIGELQGAAACGHTGLAAAYCERQGAEERTARSGAHVGGRRTAWRQRSACALTPQSRSTAAVSAPRNGGA